MKINKLNVNQIVFVQSIINATHKWYEFREAKRFLFWKKEEGFYNIYTIGAPEYISNEEIEADGRFFIKDQKVHYKPHLVFRMSDGSNPEKYFNTEQELQDFMESEEMKLVKWIDK